MLVEYPSLKYSILLIELLTRSKCNKTVQNGVKSAIAVTGAGHGHELVTVKVTMSQKKALSLDGLALVAQHGIMYEKAQVVSSRHSPLMRPVVQEVLGVVRRKRFHDKHDGRGLYQRAVQAQ